MVPVKAWPFSGPMAGSIIGHYLNDGEVELACMVGLGFQGFLRPGEFLGLRVMNCSLAADWKYVVFILGFSKMANEKCC